MPEKPTQYIANTADLTAVADAIRTKGGTTDELTFPDGFVSAIENLGPGEPVQPKDVNFIDYDGTVLHSYTVAEAAALTALPALPSHDGLICQGWNWSLADIKALGRAVTVGAMYITDDGKTRIYIHLEEGRTSPMLGCCPNGTVTVDWGDGTAPDTLTGTSTGTVKWTPTHNYAAPGDYVIKLTVNGSMGLYGTDSTKQYSGLLRHSASSDARNYVYQNAIQKVEIGDNVTSIGNYAFGNCNSLSSVTIPDGVTSIGNYAFGSCNSLSSVTIPDGVTSIGNYAFGSCYSLSSVTIPDGVTSIGTSAFDSCNSLSSVTIPDGVTSIGISAFNSCYSLSSVTIPDGVTSIGTYAFYSCNSLSSITIPDGVTSIGDYAFQYCSGVKFYDFTAATAVPTLANANAFTGIADDCEIRVPASLVTAWKAATNWAQYAKYIVGVSA